MHKKSYYHVQFNQINVNAILSSSGIFVGHNVAIGWHANSKNNYGLGSASSSILSHNTNVIYDNDVIDAPIYDNKTILEQPRIPNSANMNVQFQSINANALDTNATIAVGENSQHGWSAHSKSNEGQGSFFGNTAAFHNQNIICDQDMIDSPTEVSNSHTIQFGGNSND